MKYNSAVKLALKITPKADRKIIDNFLGTYNVGNIVNRNYYTNAKKLLKEYEERQGGQLEEQVKQ